MAWMTTYILISIVGFYALLSVFLLARMAKGWLGGTSSRSSVSGPALPNWTPPQEALASKKREQHLSA